MKIKKIRLFGPHTIGDGGVVTFPRPVYCRDIDGTPARDIKGKQRKGEEQYYNPCGFVTDNNNKSTMGH